MATVRLSSSTFKAGKPPGRLGRHLLEISQLDHLGPVRYLGQGLQNQGHGLLGVGKGHRTDAGGGQGRSGRT